MGRAGVPWFVGRALEQILLGFICAGAVTLCVYLAVSWAAQGCVRRSHSSLLIAAWYVPAMVLAAGKAPMSIAGGGFLIFTTTRLLVARWEPKRPLFSAFGSVLFWKRLGVAVACSIAIHLGVLAMARGSTQLAMVLFGMTVATLISLAMVVGAYAPGKPGAVPHSALSLLLIVLMIAGVTFSRKGGGGYGGGDDVAGNGIAEENEFPGVILQREMEKNAVLIAPLLKRDRRGKGTGLPSLDRPATMALKQTLDVSFSGEYWMFLPRYQRPPALSLIRKGNPSKLSFSTDGGPMVMEAHQPLITPIDPASCDSIQIEVAGPDMERTLALEVVLVDSDVPGFFGSERLGQRFVRSVASADKRDTLVFPFPARPRLKKFNEINVVVRQPGPMIKSVKIEIERMTLLPR
jgi:hypothetical protein